MKIDLIELWRLSYKEHAQFFSSKIEDLECRELRDDDGKEFRFLFSDKYLQNKQQPTYEQTFQIL